MAEQKNAKNAGESVHIERIATFYATFLKKDVNFAADYKLMSALSFGERSVSAFTWDFRKIRQRAIEIVDEAYKREANGEELKPCQYSKGQAPPAKRGEFSSLRFAASASSLMAHFNGSSSQERRGWRRRMWRR